MFLIVYENREYPHIGRRFKVMPTVYDNEVEAAGAAQQCATDKKARAWACECPEPPMIEVASVTDLERFKNGR